MDFDELWDRITSAFDKADFVYKGELYVSSEQIKGQRWKSFDYLPDIVCDVAEYLGYDWHETSELLDYVQSNMYNNSVNGSGSLPLCYEFYLSRVRDFLLNLID